MFTPDWTDLNRQVTQMSLFAEASHPQGGPSKARDLAVEPCDVHHARTLVAAWHSRLPTTQVGPWMYAFRAHWHGFTYGVALWNNPSARTLPAGWLELRRLAVSDDAPHCTASRMIGQMARWFQANRPDVARLISYQDQDVHTGTIYKASGWHVGYESKPRVRDRSGNRPGSNRLYRSSINGPAPDAAGKNRWELDLTGLAAS